MVRVYRVKAVYRVYCSGFRVQGSGFGWLGVQGSGFRVYGLGWLGV